MQERIFRWFQKVRFLNSKIQNVNSIPDCRPTSPVQVTNQSLQLKCPTKVSCSSIEQKFPMKVSNQNFRSSNGRQWPKIGRTRLSHKLLKPSAGFTDMICISKNIYIFSSTRDWLCSRARSLELKPLAGFFSHAHSSLAAKALTFCFLCHVWSGPDENVGHLGMLLGSKNFLLGISVVSGMRPACSFVVVRMSKQWGNTSARHHLHAGVQNVIGMITSTCCC